MGNAFSELNEPHKALSCYRKTLELKPDHTEAGHNAGLTLKDLGRFDDAVLYYQKALQFRPDTAEIHYNLGNVYKEAARFQEAVSCYQKAIDLDNDMVEAHYNMANALKESGVLGEAVSCYERVLEIAPDHFGALNNGALAYRDSGQIDRAMEMFKQALNVRPDHVEIRWNRALALLLCGEFVEGWKEYDVRFYRDDLRTTYPRRFEKPRWDGSSFGEKTLLVHHEQGLGDTIQFVRYLPMVKERGGRVVLEVHESMLDLCRNFPGADHVISRPLDQDLNVPFDCYVPLLSLPGIFNTTLDTIPSNTPYLLASPEISEAWKDNLDTTDFKIGLVWAGNPGHKDDGNRSCPLSLFAPLNRIPGVAVYALQKNDNLRSREALQQLGFADLGEALTDFSITAGIIANLDLIISVDTAVAHLAGAMGKPVWILLPFVPDWRWLMEREDSPWYPTARLFRQKQRGDWTEVIGRVAAQVNVMAGQRTAKLRTHHGRKETVAFVPGEPRIPMSEGTVEEALQCYHQGRWEETLRICEAVLAVQPTHAEALHVKGLVHHGRGEYEKAVDLIKRAIDAAPDQPAYFNNLGAAHMEAGDSGNAVSCYHQAIQLKPDFVEACHNLGKAYLTDRRFEEAVSWFERAVGLRSDCHEAYSKLGEALLELGRPQDAIDCGKRLLEISGGSADGHFIIGNGLKEEDRFEAAIASYEAALASNPGHVQALVHMGLAFQFLGQIEAAIHAFERAIAIDTDHPGANLNRALALLLAGDYVKGWQGYEWRLKIDDRKDRHADRSNRPRWDGSPFDDGTVIVLHEQGLGDALQFARYLPLVAGRGENVVFEVDRRLLRILRGLADAEGVSLQAREQGVEIKDAREIPLLSLPGLFQTTLETIPAKVPYLKAEANLVEQWSQRLRGVPGFRIGISWQGNPSYRDDRHRSAPLRYFADLTGIEGVSLVSLQKGVGLDQMARFPREAALVDLGPELDKGEDAFVDTAGVMSSLDLIITTDTAIPHLAGALGVPVWLVLPHIPDWRWGLTGETCPWYPTMRLFRQETTGDWPGVFHRVGTALKKRIQEHNPSHMGNI